MAKILIAVAGFLTAATVFAGTVPVKDSAATLMSAALESDLHLRHGSTFDQLLSRWETRYGAKAVPPLLHLASNRKLEDSERYIALMGAARLGGREAAPLFVSFLKDRSWMLRSCSLRILGALGNAETAATVLPLLKDPALVVRAEAVDTVAKLRPPGAADALLATLEAGVNYHGGKAQWVPQRALAALVTLGAREAAPRLKPLLDHQGDPELQTATADALEKLTGLKPSAMGVPIAERVRSWKKTL